jgi:hypothetical protein
MADVHHRGLFLQAALLVLFFGALSSRSATLSDSIDFDRDVRPILSDNCFFCHGSDAAYRKAKLRLDVAGFAVDKGDIVPGQPEKSELVKRILSTKTDEHMPPPDSNRKLTDDQKAVLKQWIREGAKYEVHWAYKTPVRPKLPAVRQKNWPRNPIDYFILATLEKHDLKPTPEAPMERLLRRVSLDLDGLPPSSEQMTRWQQQKDPLNAAVDELLGSPHFGEREASDWMDVARYADTHGFNNDMLRTMWRWRDWVIDSFNRNLPYDQFITDQLAGDLLPHPTLDQLIATGFNRNHVINSEGGIIGEEYRVEYVADRVRITSMAWMGLTMECARCHDHKFDPITQKNYYQFFAYFNNLDEIGEDGRVGNAAPMISAPTPAEQKQMAQRQDEMDAAENKMRDLSQAQKWDAVPLQNLIASNSVSNLPPETNRIIAFDFTASTATNSVITNLAGGKPFAIRGAVMFTNGPDAQTALLLNGKASLMTKKLPEFDAGKGWAFSAWVRRDRAQAGALLSTMRFNFPESAQQYGEGSEIRFTEDGKIEVREARRWPAYAVDVITHETVPVGQWRNILVMSDGSAAKNVRVFVNGEECFIDAIHDSFATVSIAGKCLIGHSDEPGAAQFAGALAGLKLYSHPVDSKKLAADSREQAVRYALAESAATVSEPDTDLLQRAWLQKQNPDFAKADVEFETAKAELQTLDRDAPTTMIMRERTVRRPTYLLSRGIYNQPREEVQPGIPEFLPAFMKAPPRNRLELAHWFTDPRNPLTARVVVNRFWQSIFGTGIVKTSENFGYQSEWPSHPQLLDWLAVQFVDSGWDVKKLLRLMVTSATYRQDSRSTPELNEVDPENRWLAHGPRQRLTAEMIRDQALFLSGLLHDEIDGPPAFPYQPKDLYKGIVVEGNSPGTVYVESTGDDLYRRSVYTFWKRTVPYPSLSAFDVPDRDVCVVRRSKTDTPQQALVLMNETLQLEAARKLAERMLTEGGKKENERLSFAFESATARKLKPDEQKILDLLLDQRLAYYRQNPADARNYISVGASKPNPQLDPSELAAYANVASLIMNLDETIERN